MGDDRGSAHEPRFRHLPDSGNCAPPEIDGEVPHAAEQGSCHGSCGNIGGEPARDADDGEGDRERIAPLVRGGEPPQPRKRARLRDLGFALRPG